MSLISSFQWESAATVPEAFFGAGAAEPAIVSAHRAEPLMASVCDKDGATRDYLGPDVWIECNEQSGVAQIHDPRLFRPGLEAFCRASQKRPSNNSVVPCRDLSGLFIVPAGVFSGRV